MAAKERFGGRFLGVYDHAAKKKGKVAVLTQSELDDLRVKKVLYELGWGDAKLVSVEGFAKPDSISNQKVNDELWCSYTIMEYCSSFDHILITLYAGAAYYALQTHPEKVSVFPYRSLITSQTLGEKIRERMLVRIELEEYIFRHFQDNLCFYNKTILEPIWHKLSVSHKTNAFRTEDDPSELLRSAFFLQLPPCIGKSAHNLLFHEGDGLCLEQAEYLEWAEGGIIPKRVTDRAKGRNIFLIDEGNDFLSLQTRFIEMFPENKIIVAYDQEIPTVNNVKTHIPACPTREYFDEMVRASKHGCFIHYGECSDFIKRVNLVQSKILLSIVITFHNRLNYLDEILNAFNNQSNLSFELIIIDNGSTEKLCESRITNKETLKFNLSFFNSMNMYPGAARNIGAEMASGDYITFFDDDNIPKNHFVESLLTEMENRNFDLMLCFREGFVNSSENLSSLGITLSAPHLNHVNCFRNFIGDNVFIMSRARFLELKYTNFFQVGREDIEFLNFAKEQGCSVGLITDALYYYRLDNRDKIGRAHLTHRTGDTNDQDYGAYRKYRRSKKTFAARKFSQFVDNQVQNNYDKEPRKNRPFKWLRRRLRHVAFIRRIYYSLKT